MLHALAFVEGRQVDLDGQEINLTVDDQPLAQVLGYPGMYGLSRDEWRITARTLQGWMPQELGLERERFVPKVKPVRAGLQSVFVRQLTEVLVTLPGGDEPEVSADEVESLVSYDSVPLLSCGCGGGVGCGRESVSVTFERSRAHWTHNGMDFSFDRASYGKAIEHLLLLLGEQPQLISEEEWLAPMQTRVIEVGSRYR